jgi:hypothetical protein
VHMLSLVQQNPETGGGAGARERQVPDKGYDRRSC